MIGADSRMASHLTVPFARGADRLDLRLDGGATSTHAGVTGYDFAEHVAAFGDAPQPRYLLRPLRPVPAGTVVTVGFQVPGAAPGSVAVPVPAQQPVLAAVPAGAVVTSLDLSPAVVAGTVADAWAVTALLGDLAALLWVVGAERDALTAQVERVRGERTLDRAGGHSLDLIGADLSVPRFPPLPYVFDAASTVVLYHLDEAPGTAQIADAAVLYGRPGHAGTATGVTLGVPGRFGGGVRFGEPAGEITVADHADFALPAGASLTAECFVRPDSGAWQGDLLSKHADPNNAALAGWALSIGAFGRGVPGNVRFLVSDGTRTFAAFGDLTLPSDRFTHVAGVLDGAGGRARLYLDGVLRADVGTPALGALTSTAPLRAGRAGVAATAALHATVDEIRLSRVARGAFTPVLGEADEVYRRRLGIFRRWTLPTPEVLQRVLNDVAGPVNGVAGPFVVDDSDAGSSAGSLPVTVTPGPIPAGGSLDAFGRREQTEAAISGVAADDPQFDPAVLVTVAPGTTLSYPDGTPAPMRVGARRALLRLLGALGTGVLGTGVLGTGVLRVHAGYQPDATDLRAVGRALVFDHSTVASDALTALAARSGFDWVRHLPDGTVYGSVSSTEAFDLTLAAAPAARFGADLLTGESGTVALDPPAPPGSGYRWSVMTDGPGAADLLDAAGAPVFTPWDQASATVRASRPGAVTVEVDVRVAGRTLTAARTLHLGVAALTAGHALAADGTADGAEPPLDDQSDTGFGPGYVSTVDDARLSATGVAARRIHPGLGGPLAALLTNLAQDGATGTPQLTSAWRPDGTGLETRGRAVTLARGTSTATLDRIAALAHAAGFDYVRNSGTDVRLAHQGGESITVTGAGALAEGASATYSMAPRALPGAAAAAGSTLVVANTGTDTLSVVDTASGRVTALVKVGWQPVGVAVTVDGTTAYTADTHGSTVTVVSLASRTVTATLTMPAQPRFIAHHPTSHLLVVALADRLVVLNDTTNAVTGTVTLPAAPTALAVAPAGAVAWVALADGTVHSATLDTFTLSAAITLPGVARGIAVSATRAYLALPAQQTLSMVDTSTRALTSVTGIGTAPTAVAVNPGGTAVHLADTATGRVLLRKADGTPNDPDRAANVVGTPVALVPAGGSVYVVCQGTAAEGADAIGVLDPDPATFAVTAFWALGTGAGERTQWSVQPALDASAHLDAGTTPVVTLGADTAGPVLVVARYQAPDRAPFTIHIRLNPALTALEQGGTPVIVGKDQYDLVMNVLNELHPVGVEVDTTVLRAHVAELSAGLADVFPAYTYPTYRLRVPPARRTTKEGL